jgi:CrcB protein
MSAYLWVALGSALGGVGRVWVGGLAARHLDTGFPWGTLLVNILGSFAIGLLAALTQAGGRLEAPPHVRQFLMAGVLGGFTTFSAFSLQTLELLRGGDWPRALANILASLVLCLAAVAIGHHLGRG